MFNNDPLYDDKKRGDAWMEERMDKFEKCRESVLMQSGDFKWIISIDKRTPKKYMDHIFTDERMIPVHHDIRDTFKHITPETDWVITSRLDNDDQYLPGAVDAIQSHFEPKLKVIDVGFYKYEWDTGKYYEGERPGGRNGWKTSMFVSLVEPRERVITAFCRPHGQIGTEYPMSGSYDAKWGDLTTIDEDIISEKYAIMVCHNSNAVNKIRGKFVK